MANVDVGFTSKGQNAPAAELEKIHKQMQRLEDKTVKLTGENKRLRQANERAHKTGHIDRHISKLATLATSTFGVYRAQQLYNDALAEQVRIQQRVSRGTMTVADSQAALSLNLGAISGEDKDAFIGRVAALREELKFQAVEPLNLAAGSIASSVGGDQEKTLKILKASAPLFRHKPEELGAFGGAVGAFMDILKVDDADAATAFMLSMQGQSRFESLDAFREVAPALKGGMFSHQDATTEQRIEEARQQASLLASLTIAGEDVHARKSKTFFANMLAGMEEVDVKSGSMFERLAAMHELSPEKQEKAWMRGDAALRPVMRSLFTDSNSPVILGMKDAYEKIGADTSAAKEHARYLREGTPALRHAGGLRSLEGIAQESDIQNETAQAFALARQSVWGTEDKPGAFKLSNWGIGSYVSRGMRSQYWKSHFAHAERTPQEAMRVGMDALEDLARLAADESPVTQGGLEMPDLWRKPDLDKNSMELLQTIRKQYKVLSEQLQLTKNQQPQLTAAVAGAQRNVHAEP